MSREQPANQNGPSDADPIGSRENDVRTQFGFGDDDRWMQLAHSAMSDAPCAPDMLGPFKVLEHVGRGGQGSVYKVLHPQTGRPLALKRLALGAFASTRDRVRFQRELQATASLSHPCIVSLLGHDTIDNQPVLLMEWIDGQPVDWWAKRKDVSVRDVLAIFARICDAVAHAHQRGVLHRDLKPANVLVVKNDENASLPPGTPKFEPKVLDFGLSRFENLGEYGTSGAAQGGPGDPRLREAGGREAGVSFTATQGFMGTPAYAPPEQASARWNEVDTRSDVYAIGVMLYEALTGVRPFVTDDLASLLAAISHQEPDCPSKVASARARGVDDEIDAIVMKAIAKHASQRYQSADAFASDLRRKLAGQAVLAHPPKLLYQTRAIARQHRTVVTLGAIAIAGLAGLAIVSTTLASRLSARGDQLVAAVAAQQEATKLANDKEAVAHNAASTLRDMLEQIVIESTEAGVVAPIEAALVTEERLRKGEFAQLPELELGLWNLLSRLAYIGSDVEKWDEYLAVSRVVHARVPQDCAEVGLFENMLGLRAESKGELQISLQHYERAFAIIEAARGRLHTDTLRVLGNFAGMTRRAGKWQEALPMHRELLERRIAFDGPNALPTASAWSMLAQCLRVGGQHEESRAALSMAQSLVDWDTQATRSEAMRIVREMSRRGRSDGDVEMEERAIALAVVKQRLPRGTGQSRDSFAQYEAAEFFIRQQRFDEALAMLDEANAIDTKYKKVGDLNRAAGFVLLAEELARRGEKDETVRPRAKAIAQQAGIEMAAVQGPQESWTARSQACIERTRGW